VHHIAGATTATLPFGCLFASVCLASGVPADRLRLHMPLDDGALLAHPANATVDRSGEASFQDGRRGTGLVVDGGGRSIRRLTVAGDDLADPAQGTIALWVKPLVDFEKGRHTLVNLFSTSTSQEALYLFIEGGKLFMQSRAGGKWPGVNFHFGWVNRPSWDTRSWYHIAVTYGMQHPTTFYVNGERVWNKDTRLGFDGTAAPVDRVAVGCSRAGTQQADAVLDDLMVFDVALEKDQIAGLMSSPVSATGPTRASAPTPRGGDTYYLRPGDVVLALGDATTAGGGYLRRAFGDEFARAYRRLASGDERVRLVNEATAGATAGITARSVDRLLDRHRPDVVLVCFGANDFYRPAAAYGAGVRSLVAAIKRRPNVAITLLTPPCLSTSAYPELRPYAGAVASMIAELEIVARDDRITLADCYNPMRERAATNDLSWGDGVHPGAAGEQAMADALQVAWGLGRPLFETR